jgi:aspartate-semialdehyde dehydrogenase
MSGDNEVGTRDLDRTVAIAGATGALGKEIVAVLADRAGRPARIVPCASPATSVHHVDYGDMSVAVEDLRQVDWGTVDALVLAVPEAVARTVVPVAAAAGVPVIDLSGSQFDDLTVPLFLPSMQGDATPVHAGRAVVAIPGGPSAMLASVLGPLALAGWRGDASATVALPASHWGREGIEELSKQVVSLFNSGTPPRKVFEQGLAFDLIPQVGTPGATGWTGAEARAMAEIARLAGRRCDVTLVGAPLFTGMSATVRITVDSAWTVERVLAVLDAAGVEVTAPGAVRKLPRPRKVDGSSRVHVARARHGTADGCMYLWVAADNLRLCANAAADVLLRALGEDDAS